MKLIFLYGQAAAGKLTVARALAARTGYALFHNHLVVDAVGAVFPFGSPDFVRLRERFWLDIMTAAARADRSLIFTFAPESSVAPDFPERAARLIRAEGGEVLFVALTVDATEQERRIANADRSAFGKLTSIDLLRTLHADFCRCMAAMPPPLVSIDTGLTGPDEAAAHILSAIGDQ
nr:shikimate kinase [Sphingobium sp. BYY-5]